MHQQEENRVDSLAVQECATSGNAARAAEKPLGRDEWLGMGQMMMKTFPDGRREWSLVEAVGDHGIPATGKVVKFSLTLIDKHEDGKLVERRGELDSAGLMHQLTQ